jgi:hypothetical protein
MLSRQLYRVHCILAARLTRKVRLHRIAKGSHLVGPWKEDSATRWGSSHVCFIAFSFLRYSDENRKTTATRAKALRRHVTPVPPTQSSGIKLPTPFSVPGPHRRRRTPTPVFPRLLQADLEVRPRDAFFRERRDVQQNHRHQALLEVIVLGPWARLPKPCNPVCVEGTVVADNWNVLRQCLRNQQPIEWVSVMEW